MNRPARTRQEKPFVGIVDLFKGAPIWAGPVAAGLVFAAFEYLAPLLLPAAGRHDGFQVGVLARPLMTMAAWGLAAVLMLAWCLALIWKLSNRRLLASHGSFETIRGLTWRDFERLVCEAYRRQGFTPRLIGGTTGDGGVDIEMSRGAERVLVQCKQWRASKVGVTTVRELLGVVAGKNATKGIVVTSGRFTQAAMKFARNITKLELVDGAALAALIGGLRQRDGSETGAALAAPPLCPACGGAMVLRTVSKGPKVGERFWGCSAWPRCHGTYHLS